MDGSDRLTECGSLSSPDMRRDSGGDINPFRVGAELAVDDGYEYGGGGPGYMVVGLAGGMLDMVSDSVVDDGRPSDGFSRLTV